MVSAVSFKLTDAQWHAVNLWAKLAEAAREELDICGSKYLTFCAIDQKRARPHTVKGSLNDVSDRATDLIEALRNIDVEAVVVPLNKEDLATPMREGLYFLMACASQTEALRQWCKNRVKELNNKNRGYDPANLKWMVRTAAAVYDRHSGGRAFSGTGECKKYISAFVRAVDKTIRDGKIDGALKAATARPQT